MINMAHVDITRTSWYQEGIEKGIQEGEKVLLMRLLNKRFGKLKPTLSKKIEQLSLEELEQLTDDFLSLDSVADLTLWLVNKSK